MFSVNLSFSSWDGRFLKTSDECDMITSEIRQEKEIHGSFYKKLFYKKPNSRPSTKRFLILATF